MPTFDITMDIADTIDKMKRLGNLTLEQIDLLERWSAATVKMNKDGQIQTATIDTLISENQKLVATYSQTAKGTEAVTFKIKEQRNAMQLAAEAAKQQAAAQASLKRAQQDALTRDNTQALESRIGNEQSRLRALGIGGLDTKAEGRLAVIGRRIAEVGAKAGQSEVEINHLFDKISKGDFSNIDPKLNKLVAQIVNFNNALAAERDKLAKGLSGGGSSFPAPETPHIQKMGEYFDLLTRIKSTLTNLAIYRGFNAINNAILEAVSNSRDLQIQISLIRTLSQDAQQTTGKWTQDVRALSDQYGFAATEVAELFYDVTSSQVASGAAVQKFASETLKFARVANSSAKDAGKLLAATENTFGSEAGSLEERAAKLFAAIDRGNIVAGDLSDTFGKVATNAREIGVSMDETLSALATLTRSGLSTDVAMTLLTNVFKSLADPSEKAKKALSSIGIESAVTATKLQGFRSVFSQVVDLVKDGKIESNEFFPDIRGNRGFQALAQAQKAFDQDFLEISQEANDRYAKAVEIRAESAADKIVKAQNSFKNALSDTFGDSINKIIGSMIDLQKEAVDLEKDAKELFKTIATGAAFLVTANVAMRVFAVLTEIAAVSQARKAAATVAATVAQIRETAATQAQTVAEQRLNAARNARAGSSSLLAFGATNPVLGIAALSVAAIGAYSAYNATSGSAVDDAAKKFEGLLQDLKSAEISKEIKKVDTEAQKLRTTFDEMTKTVAGDLAKALSGNNKELQRIQDTIKKGQDTLRAGFVGALDLAKNKLQEMERSLNQIPNRIDASKKAMSGFQDTIQGVVSGNVNRYAAPFQKEQLFQEQINRTVERIKKLYQEGSQESVSEGRKLLDEVARLIGEKDSARFEYQKQQFEKSLQDSAAQGFSVPQGEIIFWYDRNQLQKELNQLLSVQNQLEQVHQAQLVKEKSAQEVAVAREKERIAQMELAVQKFQSFSIFTEQGNVRNEFQDNFGKFDTKKVSDQYNQIIKDVQQFLPKDVLSQLDFGKIVDERKKLLSEEVKRATQNQEIVKAQQDLVKAQELVNQKTKDGVAQYQAYTESVTNTIGKLKELTSAFEGLANTGADRLLSEGDIKGKETLLGRAFGRATAQVDRYLVDDAPGNLTVEAFERLKASAREASKAVADLDSRLVDRNGRKVIDPQAIDEALTKIKTFQELFRKELPPAAEKAGLGGRNNIDPNSFLLPGDKGTFGDTDRLLQVYKDQLEAAKKQLGEGDKSFKGAENQVRSLNDSMSKAKANFDGMRDATAAVAGTFGAVIQQDNVAIQNLIQNLETAKSLLNSMQVGGGAAPERKAYGGPIGTDNIMAWVGEGEGVLNKGAMRRFYSQFVSMNNAGRVPQYFSGGGEVTNVNGVTINVNGSGNPNVTGREVQRVLKRGKRLGQY
jgi:TP901 family phage tail tape measure protein